MTGALPLTEGERARLEALGLEIVLHPDERAPVEGPETYEAAICNGLFQYADHRAFSRLRFVQLTSAGMDRVPVEALRARGIRVSNAAGVYAAPMAEWTVMALLELCRNAPFFHGNQRLRRWEKDRGLWELSGRRACILGFGAYGRETARRLGAFGVERIVAARTPYRGELAEGYVPLSRLDQVLPQADILILALALAPETENILDERRLRLLRPTALVVNAARGGLVDQEALIRALSEGRIRGAALDVFQREPLPPESPLWDLPGVLVFPHNAFAGEGTHRRLFQQIYDRFKEWSVERC